MPPRAAERMLSVVIPTKDRRETLLTTLRSLEGQREPERGFEVVVADNGSRDGSADAARELADRSNLRLSVVDAASGGPAAARNRGVEAARGEVILFWGDDVEPAGDGLLDAHARLHEAGSEPYGVLGRVAWSERQEVTPFMRWLERGGFQFSFGALAPGPVAATDAFWTAHVSLSRGAFERAGGFDERFPDAAVEDVELGLRLDRLGVVLDYRPELLALHTHPTALAASLSRQRRVGRSAALLHEIEPGWDRPGLGRPGFGRRLLLRGSAPACRVIAAVSPEGRLRDRAWKEMHVAAYARGLREGPPGH